MDVFGEQRRRDRERSLARASAAGPIRRVGELLDGYVAARAGSGKPQTVIVWWRVIALLVFVVALIVLAIKLARG